MENNITKEYPSLGLPIYVKENTYLITNKAAVGQSYSINCPHCKTHFVITANKEKGNIERCPTCNSRFGYNAKIMPPTKLPQKKTERAVIVNSLKHTGVLEWGRVFSRKKVLLHIGTNTIGRQDTDEPSEISFKDDYMSRRSITIDVQKDMNRAGYTFKLTVLNASNPVFVNSKLLHVGNSIYLNYHDTIKLGNTVLTFIESK